ncbi:LpxI family protein [Saccharibacter floricola]|uniref:LpxI family protein n=1 Tax=Saccharibacter floricola TaxID=231053 RepID=UPI0003A2D846|nr:UDP-2,3-diacylglucosamine diphosphatase LpxI [Saccharibacter floricola]
MKTRETVGIIAGGGPLPAQLAQAVQRQGRAVFLVGIAGFANPELLSPFPHRFCRLAAAGEILDAFRAHHCRELVLIGPIKRPAWRDLKPDAEGARILMRLGRAVFSGDDGLLASVVRVLEEKGFAVRGAHEFLHDELGPRGALGRIEPDEQAHRDMERAARVLRVMAPLDIGQGCVVQNGLVLAVEALEGTDGMLQRCRALKQEGVGGILLKMPKTGQELRADMPALGAETVRRAAEAGLRGIAFAAGGTLLMNKQECVKEADRLGLFLYGYAPRVS